MARLTDGGGKHRRAVQMVPLLRERYRECHHLSPTAPPAHELVRLEVRARDVPEGALTSSTVPFSLLLLRGRRLDGRDSDNVRELFAQKVESRWCEIIMSCEHTCTLV